MMAEQMTTGAREAIRIAGSIFPTDLMRQRDLAREIISAINLCEEEFAKELIRKLRLNADVGPVGERSNG
jgi:hypothetical protein